MLADTKSALPTVADYNERKLESEWLRDHSHEYPGEWVALDGNRLLAHGRERKAGFCTSPRIDGSATSLCPFTASRSSG